MTQAIGSDSHPSGPRRKPARREEVPGLTGLRFVAAFSVLLAHGASVVLADYRSPGGVVYWLTQASGIGMTLFFVLSGFVIHYNYAATVSRGSVRGISGYLWARFARLYPLFLLLLLGYLLVSRRHFDFWRGHPEEFESVLRALPFVLLSVQSWLYLPIDGHAREPLRMLPAPHCSPPPRPAWWRSPIWNTAPTLASPSSARCT
jgi:hypothetical protein